MASHIPPPPVTAREILEAVPVTRKTLWLWQKKYRFFPDPDKTAHPGGKGIIGYYPAWVLERCRRVYDLQKKGYTVRMIHEALEQEAEEGTCKILFLTPDKKLAAQLSELAIEEGYRMQSAGDTLSAGLAAAGFSPSIIVLDTALTGLDPEMDFCGTLKSHPKTRRAALIVLDEASRISEKQARDAGADVYVEMPVSAPRVLALCQNIFSGRIECFHPF